MAEPLQFLAVLVLYRMSAGVSPAYRSIRQVLDASPEACAAIELMLCDNSPEYQKAPPEFKGAYLRDPLNPGLAKHYNAALQAARARDIPWLILLDQDTTVNSTYLTELLATAPHTAEPVVALVPKLMEKGVVQSPRHPPGLRREIPFRMEVHGVLPERVHVYNSGAALRVAALEAIGGFPEQFPLDFLDHTTFHLLQSRGGSIFALRAVLAHELSGNRADRHNDPAFWQRLRRVRDAEYAFYHAHGTPRERLLCSRRFLLRAGRAMWQADWPRFRRYLRFGLQP